MFEKLNEIFVESTFDVDNIIITDDSITFFSERYDDNDYEFIQKKFFFFYQYIHYIEPTPFFVRV